MFVGFHENQLFTWEIEVRNTKSTERILFGFCMLANVLYLSLRLRGRHFHGFSCFFVLSFYIYVLCSGFCFLFFVKAGRSDASLFTSFEIKFFYSGRGEFKKQTLIQLFYFLLNVAHAQANWRTPTSAAKSNRLLLSAFQSDFSVLWPTKIRTTPTTMRAQWDRQMNKQKKTTHCCLYYWGIHNSFGIDVRILDIYGIYCRFGESCNTALLS